MAILIVHKNSFLQRYITEKQENIRITKAMSDAHETHNRALSHIIQVCKIYDTDITILCRDSLSTWTTQNDINNYDVIVSVGGDGTFLDVSHYLTTGVLFGVNSDPIRSVGHYCSAGKDSFEFKLKNFDDRKAVLFSRLIAVINNTELSPILNELSFTNAHPAGVANYELTLDKYDAVSITGSYAEIQKSTGVLISTASGSTAWNNSAIGQPVKVGNNFQYIIREQLYPASSLLKNEILNKSSRLTIKSKTRNGLVSIDGTNLSYNIGIDDVITIGMSNLPLKVVA